MAKLSSNYPPKRSLQNKLPQSERQERVTALEHSQTPTRLPELIQTASRSGKENDDEDGSGKEQETTTVWEDVVHMV